MKLIISLISIILTISLFGRIESHSFMKCVDFDFGSNSCVAYPRNFRFYEQQGDGFIFQRGKFTKPVATELGQSCGPSQRRVAPIFDLYSSKYPMGRFQPGQKICSQWPARNHASAKRAGTVAFYLSDVMSPNALQDPNQDQLFAHEINSSPFGNCTKYYENTNNATCTSCFNLPTNIKPGVYVFQYFWEFNPKEYFITCADILIEGSSSTPNNNNNNNYNRPPVVDQDYEEDRKSREQESNRKKQYEEYLQKQREIENTRIQMQREIERKAKESKRQPTIIQNIMKNGKLFEDYENHSWGPNSRKLASHFETKPILGNVLFFKCASNSNCITTKGKDTLNLSILGYRDVVENVQVNLIAKGEKVPLTISLGPYISDSFVDNEFNIVHLPLSVFAGYNFNGITISGYDDSNSDIIKIDNINLSN